MVRSVCWAMQVAYEASEPSDRADRLCLCRTPGGRATKQRVRAEYSPLRAVRT